MKKATKRMDSNRTVLKKGESQRPNGTYSYRWTSDDRERHVFYAQLLTSCVLKKPNWLTTYMTASEPSAEIQRSISCSICGAI